MQNWVYQHGFNGNFNFMPYYNPYGQPPPLSYQNNGFSYQTPFILSQLQNQCLYQCSSKQKASISYSFHPSHAQANKSLKIKKAKNKTQQNLPKQKKYGQKDNRNVISNILRIFFKNLIELKIYDSKINSCKIKFNNQFENKQFYRWINSFKIDYKNYIKIKELKKVLSSENEDFERILRIMLKIFIDDFGLSHCLTSRRINQDARKMHLNGIKQIGFFAFKMK